MQHVINNNGIVICTQKMWELHFQIGLLLAICDLDERKPLLALTGGCWKVLFVVCTVYQWSKYSELLWACEEQLCCSLCDCQWLEERFLAPSSEVTLFHILPGTCERNYGPEADHWRSNYSSTPFLHQTWLCAAWWAPLGWQVWLLQSHVPYTRRYVTQGLHGFCIWQSHPYISIG